MSQQNQNYVFPPPPLSIGVPGADRNQGSVSLPKVDPPRLNQGLSSSNRNMQPPPSNINDLSGNQNPINIPPPNNINQIPKGDSNSTGSIPPPFQRKKTSAVPVQASGIPSQPKDNISLASTDISSFSGNKPGSMMDPSKKSIEVSIGRRGPSASFTVKNQTSEEYIECNQGPQQIISDKNHHHRIERKYKNCTIMLDGNRFRIQAQSDDMPSVISEMENLIRTLTFDSDARWSYLSDAEGYLMYPRDKSSLIERKYQESYLDLLDPNYEDYTIKVDFKANGADFSVQFARIGGFHQQVSKQSSTIRQVLRHADGEAIVEEVKLDYCWLWQHESGVFQPYEKGAIYLIEQAMNKFKRKENNGHVLIHGSNGNTYQIDFNSMVQHNEKSRFGRRIKRDPTLP